jgi:hypothetical protein
MQEQQFGKGPRILPQVELSTDGADHDCSAGGTGLETLANQIGRDNQDDENRGSDEKL